MEGKKKKNSMKDWAESVHDDSDPFDRPDITYHVGRNRRFYDSGGRGGIYTPEDKGRGKSRK